MHGRCDGDAEGGDVGGLEGYGARSGRRPRGTEAEFFRTRLGQPPSALMPLSANGTIVCPPPASFSGASGEYLYCGSLACVTRSY
eukprot:31169-Pelagococcus_subviridis.AAC.3